MMKAAKTFNILATSLRTSYMIIWQSKKFIFTQKKNDFIEGSKILKLDTEK